MGSNRRRKRRRSLPEIILAIRRQREENSTCWIRSMRFSFDDSLSYPHPLSSAWKIAPIASRGRKRIRVIIAYNGGRIARGGINVSCLSTRVNPSPPLINRTLVSTRLSLSLFPPPFLFAFESSNTKLTILSLRRLKLVKNFHLSRLSSP